MFNLHIITHDVNQTGAWRTEAAASSPGPAPRQIISK